MYASLFHLDLGSDASSRERDRSGRALATALASVPGFLAFLALETADGGVTGLCICEEAMMLGAVQQVAEEWQRARAGTDTGTRTSTGGEPLRPLLTGEVIVQRGF